MSLLLEALKKAALEKRSRGEEASEDTSAPEEPTGAAPTAAASTAAAPTAAASTAAAEYLSRQQAAKSTAGRIELPDELDHPEPAPATPDPQSGEEPSAQGKEPSVSPKEPSATGEEPSAQPKEPSAQSEKPSLDAGGAAADATEPKVSDTTSAYDDPPAFTERVTATTESAVVPAFDDLSLPDGAADSAASDPVPDEDLDLDLHSESADSAAPGLDDEDDIEADVDDDGLLQVRSPRARLEAEEEAIAKREAQRQALLQLMQRTRQVDKENHRRGALMYAALTLTAVSAIGLYYYVLSRNDDSPLAALPAAQLAADAVDAAESTERSIEQVVPANVTTNVSENIAAKEPGSGAAAVTSGTGISTADASATVPSTASEMMRAGDVSGAAPEDQAETLEMRGNAQALTAEVTTPRLLIERRQTPQALAQQINQAFRAYRAGNLQRADELYMAVLAREPRQRDALLGAASIAVQQGRLQDALTLYRRRLADDSQDSYARAGLLSLAGQGAADPELKSELKLLLEANPEQAYLHFLLGSMYAAEQDWPAAQQAFFDARARERDNPDYAYNLAVALEHIRKPDQALLQYRDAVGLATSAPVQFDLGRARRRIGQLEANAQ